MRPPENDFEKYLFLRSYVRFLKVEVGILRSEIDEFNYRLIEARKDSYKEQYMSVRNAISSQKRIHDRLRKNWKKEIMRLRKLNSELTNKILTK